VEADAFADGHDALTVLLRYRPQGSPQWTEVPMTLLGNDRWRASFRVTTVGRWEYTITAWVDHFSTWRRDLSKKHEDGQDVQIDLLIGARIIDEASARATGEGHHVLATWGKNLGSETFPTAERIRIALSPEVANLMMKFPDRRFA